MLERKDYEKFAKKKFKGLERRIVLEQIDNFYKLEKIEFDSHDYKVGDDVILEHGILVHGFGANPDYIKQIAAEGKINAEFAGVNGGHSVKYAVSTWKFKETITLHDYVIQYSGMTATWEDKCEIVPYGQLDAFVEKMKNEKHFCWEAESTKEMRFLPNLAHPNNQIALIFNMRHDECKTLLKNDLLTLNMPKLLKMQTTPKNANKARLALEKAFGERVSYILFGIPKNCIEGLFVGPQHENNKTFLNTIKSLFPKAYICNIEGKVIAE